MRTLILIVGLLCTVAASLAQSPSSRSRDEAAIRQVWADYVTTWNKHDAAALALFFTADADRIDNTGRSSKGRAAVTQAVAKAMTNPSCKDVTVSSETVDIRLLTGGVAILDARDDLKCTGNAGSSIRKTNHTSIFVKRDGKWVTTAVRAWTLSSPSTSAAQ
ncbi:MAG: SgcJ/EcaC family oxidoreductase [Bryobacteraceae bacterium]|jgi:uncharacterized protein (TIGR02246 family)